MPKAYDIKRNYYADLELPTNASIEDVRKQYRKLVLVWHPDRNSGKEDECVPRFQAIQAAYEVLSDPVQKAQYDADRRVAGPFASASAAPSGTRGNPYQAKSAYPPPPRRTAPGTYNRPPTAARPQASGADRFSSFAGQRTASGTAKDPASERTNAFTAWQSMKNKEKEQQRQNGAGSGSSTPGEAPRRPQPPPRGDTKYPSEERLRPEHRYQADEAHTRKQAWEAFRKQQETKSGPSTPGVSRSNTMKTPRKQGFDPSAPGSDERPATGHYSHRHKSEDFGRPSESAEEVTSSPRRPNIDPTNPNRRQPSQDDVPYAEANRRRTPYSSFIGEKTDFSADIRRSKSTRDSTKLNANGQPERAQSTSPKTASGKGATFEAPNVESDASSTTTPDSESPTAKPILSPSSRPKKVPAPRSRRFNGAQNASTPLGINGEQAKQPSIFDFATDGPAPFIPPPMPTGKSRSEEHINTKFAQDFNGVFSSQAEATSSRPNSRKSTASFTRQNSKGSHVRANPTFGQPSPLGTTIPPSPSQTSVPNSATATPYSPEVWKAHFADGSWAVPPPPPRDNITSPTQNVSPTDKTRDAHFPSHDGDQMDIDDNPPSASVPVTGAHAMPPPPKPPRMVPVPPTQRQQAQNVGHAAFTQDEPSLNANLDDLTHVEPLARPEGAGLQNLADLTSHLPFKSQASRPQTAPENYTKSTPAAPRLPTVPQTITAQSWALYSADFMRYVKIFQDFNGRYLSHFVARQTAIDAKISEGMGWLTASGDTVGAAALNGPTGFGAYLAETEGDAALRETWSLGCERHLGVIKAFGEVREKVRKLVEGGGLPDR